jgi:hypothetical protein
MYIILESSSAKAICVKLTKFYVTEQFSCLVKQLLKSDLLCILPFVLKSDLPKQIFSGNIYLLNKKSWTYHYPRLARLLATLELNN